MNAEKAKLAAEKKTDKQYNQLIIEGFKAYQISANLNLGFTVLGSEEIRSKKEYLQSFGVLSTGTPLLPSRFSLPDGVTGSHGSILSDSSWTIFKNDSVMLGVIHAFQTVYIDGNIGDHTLNFFFDTTNKRPRLVGREIAMLITGGYKLIKQSNENHFGYVFGCFDREKARNTTFKETLLAVDNIKTESGFADLLKKNTILMEEWNQAFTE